MNFKTKEKMFESLTVPTKYFAYLIQPAIIEPQCRTYFYEDPTNPVQRRNLKINNYTGRNLIVSFEVFDEPDTIIEFTMCPRIPTTSSDAIMEDIFNEISIRVNVQGANCGREFIVRKKDEKDSETVPIQYDPNLNFYPD